MKKISIITVCALAIVSVVIFGCVKNRLNYGDIEKFDGASQSLLKINYASQYANNRLVYFKINDQRISYLVTGRTPFPGGGYNTGGGSTADFMQVNSGDVKFSVALPHKIDNGTDSLELFTTNVQLSAGKSYVLHVTDTAATEKAILTEETFARPDSLSARFHFINLMPNVPAIDLYYGATLATAVDQSTDSLIVGNVAYLQSSPDFLMKSGVIKNWKIRPAGAAKTAATVLAVYTSTSVPLDRRTYAAYSSGYSGKTNTQKPYISFTLIR
ncbi:MAG: DUF4397 domain-containing protein [Mucilaginibacter sp.]|uniref:DUF4397 domain-containing protein n=1 Tax=Mucilaginibacter sp. TaxID=1882438 RepID=UPI003266D341